jgi:hypothetical protein
MLFKSTYCVQNVFQEYLQCSQLTLFTFRGIHKVRTPFRRPNTVVNIYTTTVQGTHCLQLTIRNLAFEYVAKLNLGTTATKRNFIQKTMRTNWILGILDTTQFRVMCVPVSCVKTWRLKHENYHFVRCSVWVLKLVSRPSRETLNEDVWGQW